MAQALLSEQASDAAAMATAFQEFDDPFSLDSIVMSKQFSPQKVVIYGVPGVGKTTFAATWPKPILLRTEDGAGALNIPTFPKVCKTLAEISKAMKALRNGKHDFQTLILDSLDWAEPLVWDYVCQENGKANIESFGFGKGYVYVDEKWRSMQQFMDKLRTERNMHIICIAHAVPVTYDPPDSDSYQRYALKLHKRAAAQWIEWAEMVLFINYKAEVKKNDSGKMKAKGTGERVIFTQERPAYQAKSRWPLPQEIYVGNDVTWTEFHKSLSEATEGEYHV